MIVRISQRTVERSDPCTRNLVSGYIAPHFIGHSMWTNDISTDFSFCVSIVAAGTLHMRTRKMGQVL